MDYSKFIPTKNYLLIQRDPKVLSKGNIVLPEKQTFYQCTGTIVAINLESDLYKIDNFQVNDKVIFEQQFKGNVPFEDENDILLVTEEHVYCKIRKEKNNYSYRPRSNYIVAEDIWESPSKDSSIIIPVMKEERKKAKVVAMSPVSTVSTDMRIGDIVRLMPTHKKNTVEWKYAHDKPPVLLIKDIDILGVEDEL